MKCMSGGVGGSACDRQASRRIVWINAGSRLNHTPLCRWHAAAATRNGWATEPLPTGGATHAD